MTTKRPKGYVPRPPGRPAKYPWKDWFDGEPHFIQPRYDFDGTLESMRQQIYTRARADGVVVQVRRQAEGLIVKRTDASRTGTTQKYDWDTLLNGETHTLVVGRDIRAAAESFRQYARRQAVARGGKLESRLVGNTLTLRAKMPQRNPLAELPFEMEVN